MALNVGFPILESTFATISYTKIYIDNEQPRVYNGILALVTYFITLLEILSGVLLVYGVCKIRSYYKNKAKSNLLNI